MALRDDLIGVVDGIRRDVIDGDLGLRLHTVQIRRRTWSGAKLGLGDATDELVTLDPRPRVRVTLDVPSTEAGKREVGDLVVSRISATYTEDDLFPRDLPSNVEFCWLIDGDEYVPAAKPEQRFLGWSIRLRRRGGGR